MKWFKVDELTAKQRVETYQPVLIIWPNVRGDHGHVGVGEPAPAICPPGSTHGDLFCSAAGGVNVDCLPWRRSFGTDKDAEVEFWTCDVQLTEEHYLAWRVNGIAPSKLFAFKPSDNVIAGVVLHLTHCNDWACIRLAGLGAFVPAGLLASQLWTWLNNQSQ